jgi:hypothetical protein
MTTLFAMLFNHSVALVARGVPLPDWPLATLRADGQAGPTETPANPTCKRAGNPVSLRQNHQHQDTRPWADEKRGREAG